MTNKEFEAQNSFNRFVRECPKYVAIFELREVPPNLTLDNRYEIGTEVYFNGDSMSLYLLDSDDNLILSDNVHINPIFLKFTRYQRVN